MKSSETKFTEEFMIIFGWKFYVFILIPHDIYQIYYQFY